MIWQELAILWQEFATLWQRFAIRFSATVAGTDSLKLFVGVPKCQKMFSQQFLTAHDIDDVYGISFTPIKNATGGDDDLLIRRFL